MLSNNTLPTMFAAMINQKHLFILNRSGLFDSEEDSKERIKEVVQDIKVFSRDLADFEQKQQREFQSELEYIFNQKKPGQMFDDKTKRIQTVASAFQDAISAIGGKVEITQLQPPGVMPDILQDQEVAAAQSLSDDEPDAWAPSPFDTPVSASKKSPKTSPSEKQKKQGAPSTFAIQANMVKFSQPRKGINKYWQINGAKIAEEIKNRERLEEQAIQPQNPQQTQTKQ